MVAMIKFSKFSENSAEQINVVIASQKDNIYNISGDLEKGLYARLFNNYFH